MATHTARQWLILNMQDKNDTLAFYDRNAHDFIEQTINVDLSDLYQPFIARLPTLSGAHILDLGCGSGRDATYFASLGYQVTALDGCQKLTDWAKCHHNADANIDWLCYNFDDVAQKNWQNKFNAVWACASLLHVPFNKLPTLINTLLSMLKANGILYASFKYGEDERVDSGRFFCDMNDARWENIKQNLNHQITDRTWLTTDKRALSCQQWFNILVQK